MSTPDLHTAPPEPVAPAPAASTEPGALNLWLLVLFAVLNAWAAVAAYHFWIAPRPTTIAVVDVAAVYREQEAAFTAMVVGDAVTDVDRARALDRAEAFARRMPVALEELAIACDCTVLAANAVAGRARVIDLTDELRRRLQPQ